MIDQQGQMNTCSSAPTLLVNIAPLWFWNDCVDKAWEAVTQSCINEEVLTCSVIDSCIVFIVSVEVRSSWPYDRLEGQPASAT